MTRSRVALLCLSFAGGCTSAGRHATDRRDHPIIGGTVDSGDPSIFFFTAWTGSMGASCTATLIDEKHLLTAAHCVVDGDSTTTIAAHDQTYDDQVPDGARLKVIEFAHHPQYLATNDIGAGYDCAVLTLAQPFTGAAPISYNKDPIPSAWGGSPVRLVGYGDDDGQAGTGSGTKRAANSVLGEIDPGVVQAGVSGTTTCQGDSGGPLLAQINGVWTTLGITSFGDFGCVSGGWYSRTDLCAPWIAQQVAASP